MLPSLFPASNSSLSKTSFVGSTGSYRSIIYLKSGKIFTNSIKTCKYHHLDSLVSKQSISGRHPFSRIKR